MATLRFATARLQTGPRLHYAEQGPVDGEPVVFLHGWPDSWFSFSRVVPELPARFHVFVPDQRGFGDSERPGRGYAIADFAADVVAFLDALAIRRATLVGHSFGSFVARRVALTEPERVGRMVLIGTGVSAACPATREARRELANLGDRVPEEFARGFQAGTVYLSVPGAFFARAVAESLKLPARLWREILDGVMAYDDSGQLGRITTPTLLVWGDHDALFARADQQRLLEEIRGARLVTYEATGHCPNWERPVRVAADLQAFLQH